MSTVQPAFPSAPPPAPAPHAVPPAAPMAAPAPEGPKLSDLVDSYRRLRDKKKEITDTHKKQLAPYNELQEKLGVSILDALNRAGVESTRTSAGTAFKSVRSSYTVQDPVELREWLEANARFDLLETCISKEVIESMISNGEPLPPGIKISSEVIVNVRK